MQVLKRDYPDGFQEAGLLRPMARKTDLGYHLERLTKEELTAMRKFYALPGLSSLPKAKLAAALEEAIPKALPFQLGLLDRFLYLNLQEILKAGDVPIDPGGIPADVLKLFRDMGVAFTGLGPGSRLLLVMPQEVRRICEEVFSAPDFAEKIESNQQLLFVCRGLLAYYGILPLGALFRLLTAMGFTPSEPGLSRMLATVGVEIGYFDMLADAVCDRRVLDHMQIIVGHETWQQFDFYPVDRETALAAAEQLYADWTSAHRDLFDFFQDEFLLTEEQAVNTLLFLVFALNNDFSPAEILVRLEQRQIIFPDLTETVNFLTLLEEAEHHTRLWRLRGYTPAEIEDMQARPHLKVLPPLNSKKN